MATECLDDKLPVFSSPQASVWARYGPQEGSFVLVLKAARRLAWMHMPWVLVALMVFLLLVVLGSLASARGRRALIAILDGTPAARPRRSRGVGQPSGVHRDHVCRMHRRGVVAPYPRLNTS